MEKTMHTTTVMVHNQGWAMRITERLRIQARNFADARKQILNLLKEAKEGGAAQLLGYESWPAYISDVFGEQPLRLERDLRRDFVKELSNEGMSSRAIAPIVGIDKATVNRDISAGAFAPPESAPVASDDFELAAPDYEEPTKLSPITTMEHHDLTESVDETTGEILDAPAPKTITGLDGKHYTVPEPKPSKPRRDPLPVTFERRVFEINQKISSLERLVEDDRFTTNKQNIADANASDIKRAIDSLSKVLDALNNK